MAPQVPRTLGVNTFGRHRWVMGAIAAAVVALAGLAVLIRTDALSHWARDRVIQLLQQHYGADLAFRQLNVRLFPEVQVDAQDLTFHQSGKPDAPPLITIHKLLATTSLLEALRTPPHVRDVQFEGIHIQVSRRGAPGSHPKQSGASKRPSDFVIDHVIADGTRLTVIPRKEGKPPLEFDIRRLRLAGAGRTDPMSFHATLRNAEPPGDIQTAGQFGPWDKDDPGN